MDAFNFSQRRSISADWSPPLAAFRMAGTTSTPDCLRRPVYSNKARGRVADKSPSLIAGATGNSAIAPENSTLEISNLSVVASAKSDHQSVFLLVEPPPKRSARLMRPLWRDLILKVWGGDPLECPCCHGTMKIKRPVLRREEVEFFLRLHGLWEGVVHLPRPPPPPFDIENLQRIVPPWRAIKEWIAVAPLWPCRMQDPPPDLDFHDSPLESGAGVPDEEPDRDWFNRSSNPSNPDPDGFDQRQTWKPAEIHLEDGRILVLD